MRRWRVNMWMSWNGTANVLSLHVIVTWGATLHVPRLVSSLVQIPWFKVIKLSNRDLGRQAGGGRIDVV